MQRKVFGNKLMEQPVFREKFAQRFVGLESITPTWYEVTHRMIRKGSQAC